MLIKAMHGEDKVLILDIKVANPKDGKEIMIIYSDYTTGIIGYEKGNSEVLDAFVIIE